MSVPPIEILEVNCCVFLGHPFLVARLDLHKLKGRSYLRLAGYPSIFRRILRWPFSNGDFYQRVELINLSVDSHVTWAKFEFDHLDDWVEVSFHKDVNLRMLEVGGKLNLFETRWVHFEQIWNLPDNYEPDMAVTFP